MTKDEALDLALNALLWANIEINEWRDDAHGYEPEDQPQIMEAITAIKQARALDKKAENARELGLDYEPVREDWGPGPHEAHSLPPAAPVQDNDAHYKGVVEGVQKLFDDKRAQPAPVQEPVAWVTGFYAGRCVIKTINPAAILPVGVALYTAPPAAQRQWVGLTDDEIQAEWLLTPQHDKAEGVWFGRRLEAKLKEKNT